MKIFFGDLEGNGLLDTITKVWCGVFKDADTGEVFQFRPNQIKEMLEFMDKADVLIFHNGTFFDFPALKKIYNYEYKGKKVDTLVLSRLLNPKRPVPPICPIKNKPHSIETWGYRVGRGKPEHEDWSVFSEDMLHRCTEDVEILALVYKELMKEAKGMGWREAFLLTQELFINLQKQEEYGWKVDIDYIHFCINQLTRWIKLIDRAIEKYLPYTLIIEELKDEEGKYKYIKKPFNKDGSYSRSVTSWVAHCNPYLNVSDIVGPFSRVSFRITDLNSNKETKDFLLKEGWEPLEWNVNTKGERTSPSFNKDDEFKGINGKLGKLIARRVQCRQRLGIIQGFLSVVKEGAIASVIANLAVTGRATHRNIVNIPHAGSFYGKQMRKIFSSREGKVLVGTDSDGCQIRMLCSRMNDPEYTKAVLEGDKKKGTDIHSVNMRSAGLTSRDTAKTFFYAFLFGAGNTKIAKTIDCSLSEAEDVRKRFLEGLPALKNLLDSLSKEFRKTAKTRLNQWGSIEFYDGYIKGLDGRPIYVPTERQCLVYALQSDEAIMMTKAYNLLHERLAKKYKWGEEYGIVSWYHDEYTIECNPEIAEDIKKISEQCIADAGEYYKLTCPHIGNGAIGKNWFDIH